MADPTHPPRAVQLPPQVVQFLLGGQTSILATVDAEQRPLTTLVTWLVARDPQTVSLAVDGRGQSLKNLRVNPAVALEVLGDDLCYLLRGTAVVEKDAMESTPFPCALVAVRIEEVRDHSAKGVSFQGPRYSFHPGKEHRAGVEEAVFRELKGPAPTV